MWPNGTIRRAAGGGLGRGLLGVLAAGVLIALATVALRGPPTRTEARPAASRPGTASAPASAPVWKIPVFQARQAERDAMGRVIRGYVAAGDKTALAEMDAVLKVMRAVPRHEFVPARYARSAYADTPLPIGHGQTISQPYMVAEMTRLLGVGRMSRVLEVGTGSGYQAAVLAHLTPHVYTMEVVKPLADSAATRFRRLGYTSIRVHHGDGYNGWAERGPFDAIVVTCAARRIPPPLIKQLKPGGRMVVPVGGPFALQTLMLVTKDDEGTVRTRSLMAVRFVPLVRGPGGRD